MPEGCIVLFTGLSAAGKTTLCHAVADVLREEQRPVVVLDGDEVRRAHWPELGFSREDREENLRRTSALAVEHARAGTVVLLAFIAPYRAARAQMQASAPCAFFEIHVDAPLSVCEQRDPKGLYRRAREGLLAGLTGIDDAYEAPTAPDVRCETAYESVEESCSRVLHKLHGRLLNP